MSNFKAHVWGGVVSSAAISGTHAIVFPGRLEPVQLGALFLMGTLGGLLPDLDSDTGKPLSILFHLLSFIVPLGLLKYIARYHETSLEFLICYFAGAYFAVNYLVCGVIKKLTAHRGIMHSIPFVMLCGTWAGILFMPSGKSMALATATGVFTGGMTHLIMDEFHSLTWSSGLIPRPNKATGTALKFWSPSPAATFFIYLLLAGTGYYLWPLRNGLI